MSERSTFFWQTLMVTCIAASLGAQTPKPAPSAAKSPPLATPTLDSGSIVNDVYRNSSLGFTCKIPFGWVDRTKDFRDEDAPQGNEPVKSRLLLAVFERPPEATGSTINSAIVIAAEKISEYSGLKTAADYFGPITELAASKGFKVANEPYEFSVGATQVVRGDFSKPRGSLTMIQSSLVIVEKGYAVSFTFIGGSEDEANELIENLSFAGKKSLSAPRK